MKHFKNLFVLLFVGFFASCGTETLEQGQNVDNIQSSVVDPAAEPGTQVGVFISSAEGQQETFFITLEEQTPSATEALLATNVEVILLDTQFGNAVCSISGVGRPANNCFGNDPSDPFWAFFIQSLGETWISSPVGVDLYTVEDGDILAFLWTEPDSNFNPVRTPPALTLSDLVQ